MNNIQSDIKTRRFYKRTRWSEFKWVLVGGFVLLTFILGYIGFSKYYAVRGESRSYLDIIYLTLQLFTLESGSLRGQITWELEIARLLSPLIAAYTIVNAAGFIFREQFKILKLKLIKGHVVIFGSGIRASLLATKFLERGFKVVLIEQDKVQSVNREKYNHGIIKVSVDSLNEKFLYRIRVQNAKYLILFDEDDGKNIEITVNARRLTRRYNNCAVTCIVHIVDPHLCRLLREEEVSTKRTNSLRIEFFDINDNGSRFLLKEFQPFLVSVGIVNSMPHVIIIGLGQFGESLLIHVVKDWVELQPAFNKKLCISIIDNDAKNKKESLEIRYPQLKKICDIIPLQMDVRSTDFQLGKFLFEEQKECELTSIYICFDNDSLGLSTALNLKRRLGIKQIPIVVRMTHESGLASLLSEKSNDESFTKLSAFGLLDRTCEPDLLLGGVIETIARVIHEGYIEIQSESDKSIPVNISTVSWDKLPENLKESNRQVADNIIHKLKAINCDVMPLIDLYSDSFIFSNEEIELMAKMEHKRWMSERLTAGWTYAPGEKDIDKKTSPYLVKWADLPEEIKKIDRDIVKRIPKFLSKVDLQVYRQ